MAEYDVNPESGLHPDPGDFAYALAEHLADGLGDQADQYLVEAVQELLHLNPGVREQVLGAAISDVREELHRQGDADAARAVEEAEQRIAERS